MAIPEEDDNTLKYFRFQKDEEYTMNEQDIERDHKSLVDKSLNTKNRTRDSLSRHTP